MLTTFGHERFDFTLKGTDSSLGIFDLDSFKLYGGHSSNEGLNFLFVKHFKLCELAVGVLFIQHIFGLFFTPSFLQETFKFLVNLKGVFDYSLSVSVVNFSLLLSLD